MPLAQFNLLLYIVNMIETGEGSRELPNIENDLILKVVGSGTLVPDPARSTSSNLLEWSGRRYLLDVGFGTLAALTRMDVHPTSIHYLFLTHFHPDHVADLVPLLFTRNYAPDLFVKKLKLYGPVGMSQFLKKMTSAYGEWLAESIEQSVEIVELGAGSFELHDLKVKTHGVNHAPESIGYRFESGCGVIAFTGDTGYSLNAARLCRNVDIAVMECAAMWRGSNHLCPEEVAELALIARPKKLLINHCYPEVVMSSPLARINAIYNGKVERAFDGQILSCSGVRHEQ